MEAGCGIAPIEYKNKSLIHAWQWAIGLEWYLLVDDPWRVVMSTDHPNGGSFLAYPQIIRLLMDRTYRRDMLKTVPPHVRERSVLADLDREYTLSEIAIITRAGPARMLGPEAQGAPRPGGRRRRHDLHARREHRDDVRAAALRDQGGPGDRRAGRDPRGRPTARRCTSRPSTTAGVEADIARLVRGVATRSAGGTIRSTTTIICTIRGDRVSGNDAR